MMQRRCRVHAIALKGMDTSMINTFDKLGLDAALIEGLKKEGIDVPTDIQTEVIPWAMQNRDIVGQSQTGSGKTLAFVLPLFHKVDTGKREMQALILAPTHELVMQIDGQIKLLAQDSGKPVTSAAIIGEVNITRQIDKLKEKPHIIVGSAGRILELIKLRKISAHTVKTIVIDEGDRMLDEHNLGVVKDVIKTTMRDRQLMAFSATMNEKALNIAKELMKEPYIIRIEDKGAAGMDIEHMYIVAEQRDKIEVLRKLTAAVKPQRAIVFINKSDELQLMTTKLQYHHINAFGIFGSASKEERKKALDGFRRGDINVLVASDIAARGLDIKGLTHIINMDLPADPQGYLHRVGRTGRMGEKGTAISIVTEKEIPFLKKCERNLGVKITEKAMLRGQITDAVRRPSVKKPAVKAAAEVKHKKAVKKSFNSK